MLGSPAYVTDGSDFVLQIDGFVSHNFVVVVLMVRWQGGWLNGKAVLKAVQSKKLYSIL